MLHLDRATIGKWISLASLIAFIVTTFIVAVAIVYRAFFSDPPVHVVSLNPSDLGILCPGESQHLTNRITIDKPIVLFFYLSTLDESGTYNINDTQTSFPGRNHPREGTFTQMLPWTVPHLPPGKYVRSLGVRGTDGRENPLFLEAVYEIGDEKACGK
jgi:hypothetical protein